MHGVGDVVEAGDAPVSGRADDVLHRVGKDVSDALAVVEGNGAKNTVTALFRVGHIEKIDSVGAAAHVVCPKYCKGDGFPLRSGTAAVGVAESLLNFQHVGSFSGQYLTDFYPVIHRQEFRGIFREITDFMKVHGEDFTEAGPVTDHRPGSIGCRGIADIKVPAETGGFDKVLQTEGNTRTVPDSRRINGGEVFIDPAHGIYTVDSNAAVRDGFLSRIRV